MPLKKIIKDFKELEYEVNKDFYIGLKDGQEPHILFIGCSDSRVNAEALFRAKAGELFQIRNIANIVPRKEIADTNYSVVSAIEYAVNVLNVKSIIVCGHSNCGGCSAIIHPEKSKDSLPYTGEWIKQSLAVSEHVNRKYPDMSEEEKLVMVEKLNAIQQLDNLMTYDFVRRKYESGELNLQAFYYDIGAGDITVYDYKGTLPDPECGCEFHLENDECVN